MIISKDKASMMYTKLNKMKSISKVGIEPDEFVQWCHTTNVINSLETDESVLGSFVLDKYSVDQKLATLILPYEVTYDGTDRYKNLLHDDYRKYDPNNYGFGDDIEIMKPADYNEVSDVILAAFRKSANHSQIQTLKEIDSLGNYVARESDGDKCNDTASSFVPVKFNNTLKKSRFMNQDVDEMFELWWVETLRAWKGSSN